MVVRHTTRDFGLHLMRNEVYGCGALVACDTEEGLEAVWGWET